MSTKDGLEEHKLGRNKGNLEGFFFFFHYAPSRYPLTEAVDGAKARAE